MSKPAMIIDCDPGHDDAMAIAVAAEHADVVGITSVAGNAPLRWTTRNALIVAELVGLDVPVHQGAAAPLVAAARHAEMVHGRTGLDGPELDEPSREISGDDAVAFIVETVRATEGIWLVPVGPMTNIAMAVRRAPDIVDRVAGVSFMGGSATMGNITSMAEFNVWADPEAAAAVLAAGFDVIKMAGLNLTHQYRVDGDRIAAIRTQGGAKSTFAADALDFYTDRQRERDGEKAGPVHDVLAVLAVTHPDLFDHADRQVEVELTGSHTRGMTVVDERGFTNNAQTNCSVGYRVDDPAAFDILQKALA